MQTRQPDVYLCLIAAGLGTSGDHKYRSNDPKEHTRVLPLGLDVWLLAAIGVSMRGGVCDLDDKHEDEGILAQQHRLSRSTTTSFS